MTLLPIKEDMKSKEVNLKIKPTMQALHRECTITLMHLGKIFFTKNTAIVFIETLEKNHL